MFQEQTAGFTLNISHPDGTSPWIHNDQKGDNVSYYLPREVASIPPVDGQQVELSLVTELVLCEVEVFAECMPGRCGWDCSDVCHCSDVTTGTYRMVGVCPYGCEGRWTGTDKRCDQHCTDTQWGPYCNNTCGFCHGHLPCDIENGHCPNGCIVSMKPPLCTEMKEGPLPNVGAIVGGVVGVIVAIAAVSFIIFIYKRRHPKKGVKANENAVNVNSEIGTYFDMPSMDVGPDINNVYDTLANS